MSSPEQVIQQRLLLTHGSSPDLRIWRQNTGQAWQPLTAAARAALRHLVDSMPGGFRPVQYGVPGQADVQGILAPSGRFVGIEVKANLGRVSPEQEKWGRMVVKFGGLYVLARGEHADEDVRTALEAARHG